METATAQPLGFPAALLREPGLRFSEAFPVSLAAKKLVATLVFLAALTCNSGLLPDAAAQEKGHATTDHKHGKPNKLSGETSPYLLAHAHNPVEWYPWGEEALAKAKRENKPIFLSIGYSSCHWCHVMERESFLDEEIAAYMNEHFVNIKVDREERPDIDSIYMTSLHTYNRLRRTGAGGGWPLSMFLTPDARPFFGGTYFPARDGDRGARVGFISILKNVDKVYREQPDKLLEDARVITDYTRRELAGADAQALVDVDPKWTDECISRMKENFDEPFGGFTNMGNPERPKFPEPSNLFFLIHFLQTTEKSDPTAMEARNMLTVTLDHMAMGGIWDHVGSGFHRYSVDRYWRIPHFEKMLYDNGQLATAYAEAATLPGIDDVRREHYRRISERICEFAISEMTAPQGAWYSALDADSEGEEGKFYRWSREEIRDALTDDEYKLFAEPFGILNPPNFEGEFYAPQFPRPFHEVAKNRNQTPADLDAALIPIRKKLFDIRAKRERPLTDTKILTSWNGLMIRGMADTGRTLQRDEFVAAAEKSAAFVLEKMRTDEGRLFRTYAGDKAKLNAYLNDYAFMIDGLIALHRASGNDRWLKAAFALQAKQDELFSDKTNGGYFFTSVDHEELLARAKNPVDGAQPSGNSVSAGNLMKLAELSTDQQQRADLRGQANHCVRAVSPLLERAPTAAPRILIAVEMLNIKSESSK